jgi:hypothetical protein
MQSQQSVSSAFAFDGSNNGWLARRRRLAALVLALAAGACSAEAQDPQQGSPSGGGGTGSKPVASAGAPASAGSAAKPSTGGAGTVTGMVTPLPLVIDQFFAPSGYMADARNGNATMTPLTEMGDTTCGGKRDAAGARGFCHIVSFTTFGTSPELTWGGVYWQYPGNNWGEQPGLIVEAGATKIRFKARGEKGGEKVGFFAGGLGLDGQSHMPKAASYDGFWISGDGPNTKTLTTEWTEYEVDLTGKTYDKGVIGGFGWGVGQDGNTLPITFYVDDIAWEK